MTTIGVTLQEDMCLIEATQTQEHIELNEIQIMATVIIIEVLRQEVTHRAILPKIE
ncbi:hypothetical protein CCAND95_10077 [Capnocytophaga canis]|nr:hypothetical protein CCAND95_10077 [Capnocytophaga canis]